MWSLRYFLQANDDPSLVIPAADVWWPRGSTGWLLRPVLDDAQDTLLAGLGLAAHAFEPIRASLHATWPEGCALTTGEAYRFLRQVAAPLRGCGIGVLVPALGARLELQVRLGRPGREDERALSWRTLTWDRLVDYDWRLAVSGEPLTRQEFEALAAAKEPLVQVRGRWVELQPDEVERALAFFERQAAEGQMPLQQAFQLALAPGAADLPPVEVQAQGWMGAALRLLSEAGTPRAVDEPPGFMGRLRPYQKVGVAWLASLRRLGLGACLADDMGLGKTIQLTALWLHQPRGELGAPGPALLVCPTSVVGNWRRELARFAPSLRVLVHHGPARNQAAFAAEAARHDVVLSTYALLHRDRAALTAVDWSDVVLDEAQNVKNAATKAAQTARRLRARWRAALTGTPVENHLTDLWSIFQFLNPGYLGSAAEFRKRFAAPIQHRRNPTATARLKALVAPFILRRVKTDRAVIEDLPEKNETKVYCTLTPEQATLYQAVLRDALAQIGAAEGMRRRGAILATLTKLKQVCDHPALLLHDRSALPGRSGKLDRLTEMLEEVVAARDRALVFTQYAEMGHLLQEHLEATFGREALFLHGGTPAAERDLLVARFQGEGGPRLFVLSIKAGGTGLNLTAASHVIHLDRWWNPAVETQATDRAFRIGQRRDVQVHKLLCAGTFEEAIDDLIERKTALAGAVVGANEAWLTEMSTEQLRDLFALRHEALP